MGKKSRADRRHHHERMLDRVKGFHWLKQKFWNGSEEEREKHLRKMAETRHPCSCHMCCNIRRSNFHKGKEKLTMQERRMKDYGNDY